MKKIMAVLGAVALAVGAALAGGVSASATDAYPSTDLVTAVWSIPGGNALDGHHFDAPQTLVGVYAGNQLNGDIVPSTCGTAYQVDVYVNDAGTKDLLMVKRVLVGPSNPYEHLIAGGSGVAYKLVQNDACPPPTSATTSAVVFVQHSCTLLGTVVAPAVDGVHYSEVVDGTVVGTAENFPAGTFYATDDGTATGNPFYGDITITATAEDGYALSVGSVTEWSFVFVKAADCGTVVVPPTSTPKPTPPVLAYTGVVTGWLIPVAFGFVLLGGAGLLLGRRRVFAGR